MSNERTEWIEWPTHAGWWWQARVVVGEKGVVFSVVWAHRGLTHCTVNGYASAPRSVIVRFTPLLEEPPAFHGAVPHPEPILADRPEADPGDEDPVARRWADRVRGGQRLRGEL